MGNLPLYASEDHPDRRPPHAHAGLWYDKFCDTWNADFRGFPNNGEGKRDWIFQFDGNSDATPVGERDQLVSTVERRRKLVAAREGKSVKFTTRSRFVTGLGREHPVENGFAWHPTLGTPFLPGSGVKGVVRAWAEQWLDEDDPSREDVERIFGVQEQVGSVVFLDAVPTAPTRLEADVMTPHYGPWYQQGPPEVPADWHSPTPIPFLTVAAGATFHFGILPRHPDDEQAARDVEVAAGWLEKALNWIGAGAKTAVGYGRFRSEKQ
ncbi:MAG: type III-B CRISPR module RAMP protein Cmr6 [Persicimonas sp.]